MDKVKRTEIDTTIRHLYICDEKPGACDGWNRGDWKRCQNNFCFHTSKESHALNKDGRKFVNIACGEKVTCWEVTCKCQHPKQRCDAKLEADGVAYCIDGKCPL